jgi:hypothetical protein
MMGIKFGLMQNKKVQQNFAALFILMCFSYQLLKPWPAAIQSNIFCLSADDN